MSFNWTLAVLYGHCRTMLSAAFGLLLFGLAPGAMAGTVESVAIRGDRVDILFDDVVAGARAFSLSGPDRIAVDVDGATAGSRVDGTGLVHAVRQGQFSPGTARIVLDLDRPASVVDGAFTADGRRLMLRLADGQGAGMSFLPPAGFRASTPDNTYRVRVPIKAPGKGVALPDIQGPDDRSRPLVVVDAGHGGHDPGAVSPHGGQREKDITLAIARSIRDRLIKGGRVRVALTRDSDRFLVLQERFGIARQLDADLFISIHADAAGNEDATGATVYTLSEIASDREAQKLAARENKANIINGVDLGDESSDVSSILIDLTQRETMNVSAQFAKLLHREGEDRIRFREVPHRFASFVVLKAPDTPSILLETGYLTNERDIAFLTSAKGRQQIADAVGNAVEVHFARRLAAR